MNLLVHLQNTSSSLIIQCRFHWQRVISKGLPSFPKSHFAQVWYHGPENCHCCTFPFSNCHSPPYWETEFLKKVLKNAFPVIHWLCRAGLQDKGFDDLFTDHRLYGTRLEKHHHLADYLWYTQLFRCECRKGCLLCEFSHLY